MAKKRKGRSAAAGNEEDGERSKKDAARMTINHFDDVADSEDEFHTGREKILLEEGPAQKRQRRLQEEEQFLEPSDEEVLSDGVDLSDDDDGNDMEKLEDDGVITKSGSKERLGKSPRTLDSDASAASEEEDEDDLGNWGQSRKDYYDADPIETEADALAEEAEARRLQQNQLQGMQEVDYGFDELEWQNLNAEQNNADGNRRKGVVEETLPKVELTDQTSVEQRKKILQSRYPEFAPLAKEFLELQSTHKELEDASRKLKTGYGRATVDESSAAATPMSTPEAKYRALGAYLSSLSMYFALFTSLSSSRPNEISAMPAETLREHPVMQTLLECRNLWERLKNAEAPLSPVRADEKVREHAEEIDVDSESPPPAKAPVKPKIKKTKSERKAEKAQRAAKAAAEARRKEQLLRADRSLAELDALTAATPKDLESASLDRRDGTKSLNNNADDDSSDFGDPTSLTAHEAAEKARRKKSLRFYTSQIAQKSSKRDAAARNAGGDADLPYKERWRDRLARLNEEAERRGDKSRANSRGQTLGEDGGDDDDDDDDDDEDFNDMTNQQRLAASRRDRPDNRGDDDDYYNTIVQRSAAKKSAKQAAAASAAAAQAHSQFPDGVAPGGDGQMNGGSSNDDGKRAITYAIQKNKGLHQHRKKEVRNPRVKKRMRFEDKQKKLRSMRSVYRPEREGKGGYAGEKTGISRGVVKSLKL